MLFGIILRATVLVIAGYFVWFASSKAEDNRLKNVGKYLAMWTFAFAVLFVIGGIAGPAMGMRGGMGHHHMGGRMGMHRGMEMHRGGMGMMGRGGMGMRQGGFMHMFHRPAADGAATATPGAATPSTTAPPTTAPAPK